jgi:hypothetical protein
MIGAVAVLMMPGGGRAKASALWHLWVESASTDPPDHVSVTDSLLWLNGWAAIKVRPDGSDNLYGDTQSPRRQSDGLVSGA